MEIQKKQYILLKDLEVYKLSRELSKISWEIYEKLSWQDKKVIGDQFITATDSIGANIAEGYARYHYLEKIRFYYIARASLVEANEHWLDLLFERNKITAEQFKRFKDTSKTLSLKLYNFISSTKRSKNAEI